MTARQLRERQYRRVLLTALGTSAAIHGAVLGWSSFSVEGPPAEDVAVQETEASFEIPALEVVTLESPSAPTVETVVAPGQAPQRIAEDPTPRAASPEARIEAQIALTMRYDFTTQRNVSKLALQPIQFAGDLAGGDDDDEHDRGAHGDSGGRSWWEGLGLAIGIGGRRTLPGRGAGRRAGGHQPVGVPTSLVFCLERRVCTERVEAPGH